MKKLFTLLFFCSLAYSAAAQLEVHATIGPSFPVGKYGSDRLDQGGYAQVGFAAELGAHWFITKRFGVQGLVALQGHKLDNSELQRDFFQNLLASSVDISTGNYSNTLILFGPFYRFYPYDTERFAWTFRANLGFMRGSIDDFSLNVTGEDANGQVNYQYQEPDEANSILALSAGTDMQYFFNSKLAARLGVTYVHANPDYNLLLPDGVANKNERDVTFFNFNVGVSLRIVGKVKSDDEE